ncbi:mitogen-activated protein kinase-binding protein 1 isoform X1 [Schistocerca americana]|uniref:mitogen-activated protein kinase-binding protein 1 isoform X1 n=1 Tax=Schistocerca americana TaxID=7009 RepID=UPI001F4F62CF|nr:mitogen-activated protein kinase-binding protein 1 isoform X1 [Schistocerca americana]
MSAPAGSKVIRAPTLKRGKSDETRISERVKLERVLGLTVSSNAALDCDPDSEQIAYSAGCTVVLFNPRKGRQQHLLNSSRKTITSVAFSADGRYLATGECGHLPSVRVWDLHQPQPPQPPLPDAAPPPHLAAGVQVAEFTGHKYGINCVAFSPSHKYVVSVGSQHDMIVNVWDWRSNIKVASNKVSTKVKAVSFAENGSYFVTVGNRHVKFWYLEYSRSAKYKEPVPLMGRSAILGEQRNNYFCDVACGRGEMADSTYAITKSGLLCEFNNRRLLDKWVELRTTSANCMTVGENLIFIGCAEGIVRCFSPQTLRFVTTLPRTHYLGVDVAQGLSIAHMAAHPNNAKYPDAIALAYDEKNCKLTCVYNDHSLYIWDVHDIKRVGKSHSFLFHSACIWGVDVFPPLDQGGEIAATMPPGSFITCSSDDTIRVWNLDPNLPPDDTVYKRNIYSNELLKVLYVDPEMTYLKDLDLAAAGAERNDSSYDGRNGVRSIRISPDGKHLASGDRAGNIRIHRLQDLQELCRIEAHDAEVLCLEYSKPESGHRFLASASRDRLIHVFSVDNDYNFLQTLDDHSSSITAVRFLNIHDQLQMVSCGADKSIIFRQLQGTPGGTYQFSRGHNVAGKTTLYDMEVDSGQKHILTACQDRNIRVYNVNSGKHSKTFKGSVSEDGSLIKVVLDTSGIYAATSCTDKTLCVYDYYSGECMATMFGHSELVTGLRFTADCRRLVSASGDGCIFVWRLPHDMVVTMHARLAQQAARAGRRPLKIPNGVHLDNDGYGSPPRDYYDPNANTDLPDYRFSVGQLPLWAKKQIADNDLTGTPVSNRQMDLPKGRWAQRLGDGGITVKSVYDSDSIIPIPLGQDVVDKRGDSDGGSKDSSIDSGTELRQYSDFKRETMIISKQITTSKVTVSRSSDGMDLSRSRHLTDDSSIGSYKYEDMESTEHDGDVEDYSEGEGESTEPEQTQRLIYYPPAEETGSDYTVNAMDVEELRRSQRKHKRSQRPEHLAPLSVSASVSGSQDSDDDDEEGASTPGTENVDKNIASLLSASTESLDRVGRRESFLKNTFESLSGMEQDAERVSKDQGGTSISSQFLVRTNQTGITPALRNVAVINAAKQARTDSETVRKREELQRRIEETRRKLQNVGHRSNLKTSQSTTDLSHLPDKNFRPTGLAQRYTSAGVDSDDGGDIDSGDLRRSCSLSDLTKPSRRPLHGGPVQVSGKANKPVSGTRTLPRHSSKQASSSNSNIMRSTSMGVLNQSDSESDLSLQRSSMAARLNGLMRPTISSQNKVNTLSVKNASSNSQSHRRGMRPSYSSVNLSQVGNNEDSSSEETSSARGKSSTSSRPRSTSTDRLTNGAPNSLPLSPDSQLMPPPRRLAGGASSRQRSAASGSASAGGRGSKPVPAVRQHQLDPSPQELPVKDTDGQSPFVDVASAPLSQQLCSSVAEQLTRTADSVVQLYKRLAVEGDDNATAATAMLQALEEAVAETQRTLRLVTEPAPSPDQTSPVSQSTSPSGPESQEQKKVMVMMQQYSDMLLSMVHQRMNSAAQQKPS